MLTQTYIRYIVNVHCPGTVKRQPCIIYHMQSVSRSLFSKYWTYELLGHNMLYVQLFTAPACTVRNQGW